MKQAIIEAHRSVHRVDHLCAALGVSRSGYYAGRSRPEYRRVQANRMLLDRIRRLHPENREAYGAVIDAEQSGRKLFQLVEERMGLPSDLLRPGPGAGGVV